MMAIPSLPGSRTFSVTSARRCLSRPGKTSHEPTMNTGWQFAVISGKKPSHFRRRKSSVIIPFMAAFRQGFGLRTAFWFVIICRPKNGC